MTTSGVYGIKNLHPTSIKESENAAQTVTMNTTSIPEKETPIFTGNTTGDAGYLNVVKFYQGFVDKFLQNEVTLQELRKVNSTIRF